MELAVSVRVAKAKAAAKQTADPDAPDIEAPSGVCISPKKKNKMPEAAPSEIAWHKFSDDCTLFGFTGLPEPVITALHNHAQYASMVSKDLFQSLFSDYGTRAESCDCFGSASGRDGCVSARDIYETVGRGHLRRLHGHV